MTKRKTKDEIRASLLSFLEGRFQSPGVKRFKFEVVTDAVREDGGWWYVPIIAIEPQSAKPLPLNLTANLYANWENEAFLELKKNILIIPALPDVESSDAEPSKPKTGSRRKSA